MLPRVLAFDLDNTLARSKQPIAPEMAQLLAGLLARTNVAVTSGGMLEQLTSQVSDQLPADAQRERLFLLPTSGGALFIYREGAWTSIYEERLTPEESARIKKAIEESVSESGLMDLSTFSYGERIELRGAQVTFSALGQHAPLADKEQWDPDGSRKRRLRDEVARRLPGFDVKTGGSTSVDVTRHGVNKAYGIRKLSEYLAIPIAEMRYIGDALYPGGNDEVVKETGIETVAVKDVAETMALLSGYLNS